MRRLISRFPLLVRFPAIADDIQIAGPQYATVPAYRQMVVEFREINLKLAPSKFKAYAAGGVAPAVQSELESDGLSRVRGFFPSGGLVICGAPISAALHRGLQDACAYESSFVASDVQRRAPVVERLMLITDPVAKYLLTRYCVSARYNHLARCVDPLSSAGGALLQDSVVAQLLAQCFAMPMPARLTQSPDW